MRKDEIQFFSYREGYVDPKEMQIESLNEAIRNRLWNALFPFMEEWYSEFEFNCTAKNYHRRYCLDHVPKPIDEFNSFEDHVNWAKEIYLTSEWHEVLTFVEFILEYWECVEFEENSKESPEKEKMNFIAQCNNGFAKEKVQYRIIGNLISAITSKPEMESIEQARNTSFQNQREHINKSLRLFSDRENPDYRNSMDESISAMESLILEITGEKNLGNKAMSTLKKKGFKMHPQFQQAVINLYQFCSDTVRHGKPSASDELSNGDENTARFMLVSCSAFINYIISEHARLKEDNSSDQ